MAQRRETRGWFLSFQWNTLHNLHIRFSLFALLLPSVPLMGRKEETTLHSWSGSIWGSFLINFLFVFSKSVQKRKWKRAKEHQLFSVDFCVEEKRPLIEHLSVSYRFCCFRWFFDFDSVSRKKRNLKKDPRSFTIWTWFCWMLHAKSDSGSLSPKYYCIKAEYRHYLHQL